MNFNLKPRCEGFRPDARVNDGFVERRSNNKLLVTGSMFTVYDVLVTITHARKTHLLVLARTYKQRKVLTIFVLVCNILFIALQRFQKEKNMKLN